MKHFILILFKAFLLFVFPCFFTGHVKAQAVTTQTFYYTGATQTFVTPPCAGSMTIDLKGASGGNAGAGTGSGVGVTVVITPTPGAMMYLNVGGQGSVGIGGFNGGGPGGAGSSTTGGGGGGASDIRVGGNTLSDRILVVGGGGGSGSNNGVGGDAASYGFTCGALYGGAGNGGLGAGIGSNGSCAPGTATANGTGGAGAGVTGPGGVSGSGSGGYGGAGALGLGGGGGNNAATYGGTTGSMYGAGGGGGGYYGGAGGMASSIGMYNCGGGGGGSSYIANICSYVLFGGMWSGHGYIKISYNNILPLPVVASSTAICSGGSVTLTASGASTYTWAPSGPFAGSNSASVALTPTVFTNYSVTATNSLACSMQTVVGINVAQAPPVISINAAPGNSICLGANVSLNAGGALSYTWSNGVPNNTPFSPTATAVYTVMGSNGCGISQAVDAVIVYPFPFSIIASPPQVCIGSATTLSTTPAMSGYTWQPMNVNTATVSVSPTVASVYTLNAVSGQCRASNTIAITVNPLPPVAMATSTSSICTGASATLSAAGGVSYLWAPIGQTGAMITVSPSVTTVYTVTGISSASCAATASLQVTVKPLPAVTITPGASLVCSPGFVTLVASGADIYSWGGNIVPSPTVSVMVLGPAMYSVTGTSTLSGCSNTAATTVNAFSPQISAGPSATICQGNTATLTASGGDPGTYAWQGLNINTPNAVVSPSANMVYMVTAQSTSLGLSCSAMATVSVFVNPKPALMATASSTAMCLSDPPVTLSVTGAQSYTWNTAANTPTYNVTSILVSPQATQVYSVTGVDANGCVNTTSLQLMVNACTSVFEQSMGAQNILLVYPNPGKGSFDITAPADASVFIFNNLGQLVKTVTLDTTNQRHLQLGDMAPGLYNFVTISNNKTWAQKILVDP